MVAYLFLPLAHVLARVTQMVVLAVGGTIVYWRGDPKQIVAELAEARPTHFPSVPRIFEKIHTAVLGDVEEQGRLKRTVFAWALAEGRRAQARARAGKSAGALARRRHDLADRLVLSKVRGVFGDGLHLAITGAAPISAEIIEFFDACGVLVLEGYGLTETCAASTLNTRRRAAHRDRGRPLPDTEVRVAPDGELLLQRAPRLRGLLPQRGGDEREPRRRLAVHRRPRLRRRRRASCASPGARRSSSSPRAARTSRRPTSRSSCARAAGSRRRSCSATTSPTWSRCSRSIPTRRSSSPSTWASRPAIPPRCRTHPAVRAELQTAVDAVNARLARIEQIKRFAILDSDLSQPAGELTPTLKIKRNVVAERYGDRVEELYA